MKEHIQTVINVCFAVFITAFIYQNGKQQDRIELLEMKLDAYNNKLDSNTKKINLIAEAVLKPNS